MLLGSPLFKADFGQNPDMDQGIFRPEILILTNLGIHQSLPLARKGTVRYSRYRYRTA